MVCALVEQVAAGWPATAPAPHVLADRAFLSTPLCATRAVVGGGVTVRRRASDRVTVGGRYQRGRDLSAQATDCLWTSPPGTIVDQRLDVATQVVVGRRLPVLPWHQRDAGGARHRARRRRRALHDAQHDQQASPTEPWVVLLTTHGRWQDAVGASRQRDHTDGT